MFKLFQWLGWYKKQDWNYILEPPTFESPEVQEQFQASENIDKYGKRMDEPDWDDILRKEP